MIYRAIQLIQIFLADERTDGRTNEGNPRGPRGPKKETTNKTKREKEIKEKLSTEFQKLADAILDISRKRKVCKVKP